MDSDTTHILLIEDELDQANLFRTSLEGCGHKVVHVKDWVEALDKLVIPELRVAVVDLGLPGISGDEICKMIREVRGIENPMAIILFSAHPPSEVLRIAQKVKADAFVSKVSGVSGLNRAIEQVIEKFSFSTPSSRG